MVSFDQNEVYDASNNRFFNFNKSEIINLLETIINSNHEQRVNMKGLIPLRVDMILMASLITQFIINEFDIKQVVTCSYSLKEGLILSS
jgi:exopolyphosphatase/guanosine-5'-triphosphate,3'-diphosphate pyrophosphatase